MKTWGVKENIIMKLNKAIVVASQNNHDMFKGVKFCIENAYQDQFPSY